MRSLMSNGRVPRKPARSRSPERHEPTSGNQTYAITGQDILKVENVEIRRLLIEQMGYETFLEQVGGLVRDRDRDVGGERQLVSIPFEDDEPLMILKVICPSTGHLHILRVPPDMRTCHQAAAWVAGFDNPDDYHPLIEA